MRRIFGTITDVLLFLAAGTALWLFASDRLLRKPQAVAPQPRLGSSIGNHGVDWNQAKVNVVLLLRDDCRFCTQTAPYYKGLLETFRQSTDVRVWAFFSHSQERGKAYLESLNLDIGLVKGNAVMPWQGFSTPTMLFCNSNGIVQGVWKGALNEDSSSQVRTEFNRLLTQNVTSGH